MLALAVVVTGGGGCLTNAFENCLTELGVLECDVTWVEVGEQRFLCLKSTSFTTSSCAQVEVSKCLICSLLILVCILLTKVQNQLD